MSFWDPKQLAEQQKRRAEEDRRRNEEQRLRANKARAAAAQAAKIKKEKTLKKRKEQDELALQRQRELDQQEVDKKVSKDNEKEERWTPPVALNRGFGWGPSKAPVSKEAQDQLRANEIEHQRRVQEELAKNSAGQEDLGPKISRPF